MGSFYNKLACITFLGAVFCFAWSTQDKLHVSVQTPYVLELKQQAEICEKETGVPASNLRKIIDKTLPTDETHNNFFLCAVVGGGFADKDGHFSVEKMSSFQVTDGKTEDYVNILKECNKIVKNNPAETVVATAECLHLYYDFAPAVKQ